MNENPSRNRLPTIPRSYLERFIAQVAENFSLSRKLESVLQDYQQKISLIRDMPSSHEEMQNDWMNACAFLCLQVFQGDIDLLQIEPASFPLLERVWLKSVKQLRAYFIWKSEGQHRSSEENYFKACNEIRQLFLRSPRKPIRDFEHVWRYLQECYLTKDLLDDRKPATNMLVSSKAQQIWHTTNDWDASANWFRAMCYVSMFYDNIVDAVVEDDPHKTLTILKAFEFSKSPANRYLIINSFETAIAINFLNKEIIHDLLKKPELYDFSVEPVGDWPNDALTRKIGGERIHYDENARQLVCEGVMSQEQKESLMSVLVEPRHRLAVEKLYQQSQLRPFADMIL